MPTSPHLCVFGCKSGAIADVLAIFLIEKGLTTEAKFMQELSAERAVY